MHNDSIETLLLRHYGSTARTPAGTQERLCASVRQEAAELQKQQRVAAHLRQYRMSRRRATKIVALGATGLGILGVGLEGLHMLEAALLGQDATQRAYP